MPTIIHELLTKIVTPSKQIFRSHLAHATDQVANLFHHQHTIPRAPCAMRPHEPLRPSPAHIRQPIFSLSGNCHESTQPHCPHAHCRNNKERYHLETLHLPRHISSRCRYITVTLPYDEHRSSFQQPTGLPKDQHPLKFTSYRRTPQCAPARVPPTMPPLPHPTHYLPISNVPPNPTTSWDHAFPLRHTGCTAHTHNSHISTLHLPRTELYSSTLPSALRFCALSTHMPKSALPHPRSHQTLEKSHNKKRQRRIQSPKQ